MNYRQRLDRLRDTFNAGKATYKAASGYTEAETRSEFIDALLEILGWDVRNTAGLIPQKREVVLETNQKQEDSSPSKKPDYTLRANGIARLHIEAKKPGVDVRSDLPSIFQARRYGYTDGHAVVALTNYETLSIYDASISVDEDRDLPETGRIFQWRFDEFTDNWDEILEVLGRERVASDDWLQQYTLSKRHHVVSSDQAFISHFNQWRVEVGQDIINRNPELSQEILNDVVQQLLNRLIFVRMCEDRGIEGENTLRDAVASDKTELNSLFDRLHKRYNTGLFESVGPDFEPSLLTGAEVIADVVDRLYSPKSPFSFAVLDADFLGLVYEASLAEHLVIDGTRVHLAKKDAYLQRDVVTTPQQLVERTIEEGFKALPLELRIPTVLDFAIGSGRFLLSAFENLIARETETRIQLNHTDGMLRVGENTWRLSFSDKKALLVEDLFGIDIDYNAVEIARFSLMIRLLEDETKETLPRSGNLLPDLRENIIHGNTLVRPENDLDDVTLEQTQPLDLNASTLPHEFDLIVGNPPYMSTEDMKAYNSYELSYLKRNYKTSHKQFDKYFSFMEFAIEHASSTGVIAVVIPNKWMTVGAAKPLRSMFRSLANPVWLSNFRHFSVFEEKSIYVCSLVLRVDRAVDAFLYSEPESLEELALNNLSKMTIPTAWLPRELDNAWVLPSSELEKQVLELVNRNSISLDNVVEPRNGVQTSRNSVYLIKNAERRDGVISFKKKDPDTGELREWSIEEAITRPYLDDSRKVKSHHSVKPDSLIIFPYENAPNQQSGVAPIREQDLKKKYPLAYDYLLAHRKTLKKRDAQARKQMSAANTFYVYGRTQALGYCGEYPKIFYSVNQTGEKYGIDLTGIVYQSGGTAGEVALFPKDDRYSLEFVLGLLDQPEIEFYLRKRGSPFLGGFYARGTEVIGTTPVPALNFDDKLDVEFHAAVTALMVELRQLSELDESLPPRKKSGHEHMKQKVRANIRALFLGRWGLSGDELSRSDAQPAVHHANHLPAE